MRILGLDPSLSGTGYCLVEPHNNKLEIVISGELGTKPGDGDHIKRASIIAGKLQAAVHANVIDSVYIENYGFASNNIVPSVIVGTILRYFMRQWRVPYYEIAPPALKKFVTGKGNVGKEVMLLSTFKRWGHEFKTNNECDAFGLAAFGLAVNGLIDMPATHMQPVEAFKSKICTQVQ